MKQLLRLVVVEKVKAPIVYCVVDVQVSWKVVKALIAMVVVVVEEVVKLHHMNPVDLHRRVELSAFVDHPE